MINSIQKGIFLLDKPVIILQIAIINNKNFSNAFFAPKYSLSFLTSETSMYVIIIIILYENTESC